MVTKERVFAARHDIGSLDREHFRIVKAGGVAGAIPDIHVYPTDAIHA